METELEDLTKDLANTLKKRNDFMGALLRDPTVATNPAANNFETFTERPQYCTDACKSCCHVSDLNLRDLESLHKIGKAKTSYFSNHHS